MIRPQVFHTIGILLVMLGLSMSLSLGWSLYYAENDAVPISQAILVTILAGLFLFLVFILLKLLPVNFSSKLMGFISMLIGPNLGVSKKAYNNIKSVFIKPRSNFHMFIVRAQRSN